MSNPLPQNAVIINGTIYELVDSLPREDDCKTCDLEYLCEPYCPCIYLFSAITGKHFKEVK